MAVLTAEQLSEPLTRLRIGYDPALVPAGGAEIIGQCASPLADAMPSNIEAAGRGFHEKILIKTGAFASREGTARSSKRFFPSILAEVAGGGVGLSAPDDPVPAGSVPASTRPRFTRHPATSPPSPARTPRTATDPHPAPTRADLHRSQSAAKLSRKASVASFQSDADAQENDPNYQGPKPDIKIGNMVWEDHYDIMGLGRERHLADAEAIRVAYRTRSLMLHPDKLITPDTTEEEKERLDDRFKRLNTANELLNDTKKRRVYDSVDAPPTKLPMKFETEDFFEKAIPAFQSLVRWFDGKGDAAKFIESDPAAPYEKVRKMYEFWAKFKSWREFPHEDEEDLESAEDRWGRRQIEQENKKKREKKKKEDTDKIRRFVERAEEKDPRVIKKRMEDKEAREAKKKAKGAGKREAEEAAKKAAEEEAAKAAAAAEEAKAAKANAKKELEKQKKALRKEKARLREQSARADGWVGHPGEDDVEELANSFSVQRCDEIKALCDEIEANENEDAIVAVLTRELAKLEGAKSEERKAAADAAAKRVEVESKEEQKSAPWDDEDEIKLLDKACNQKFPMGTKDRWERVAEYVCEHGVRPRTAKEVMTRYKAGL